MCLTTEAVKIKSLKLPTNSELKAEKKEKEKKMAALQKKISLLEDEVEVLDNEVYELGDKIDYRSNLIDDLTAKQIKEAIAEVAKKVVKTATKDIVCFKKFSGEPKKGHYVSPHRHTVWPAAQLVKVKQFGFDLDYDEDRKFLLQVNEGLHAYTSKKAAKSQEGYYASELTTMVIPKGTKYIIQEDGREIVALAMRIQNPVIVTDDAAVKG